VLIIKKTSPGLKLSAFQMSIYVFEYCALASLSFHLWSGRALFREVIRWALDSCFCKEQKGESVLRHRRSLCVIDEFGKGTLTADGIGLLAAALNAFATAPAPPKVVACTHFSEVLNAAYLPRCAKAAR